MCKIMFKRSECISPYHLSKGTDAVWGCMQEIVTLTSKAQNDARKRAGAQTGAVECQPNPHAPLLKDDKSRREWLEREINICNRVTTCLQLQLECFFCWSCGIQLGLSWDMCSLFGSLYLEAT